MEKSKGNSIIDIPNNAFSVQRFLNAIKEPIKATFQNQSFTVYGDVDRVSPWNGCYYLSLVEKASSYTYNLKIFISEQLALKNNIEIRPKMKLLVVGIVVLNKNEIQFNALQYEDLGYSRLHRQIEDWKKTYKHVFEREKKKLPLLCRRIAIISNPTIQGYEDFSKHLRYGELTVIETKMQGDKVAEDVVFAIEKINSTKNYDCILIVRGGGSFADLYEFNKPALLDAIAASMIPVASAVGHETDFPLCDFAADIRFSTPTHAGKELTERAEYLEKNLGDWKKIFSNAAILKFRAIDAKLKQLTMLISNRNKSIIELTIQEIKKQREVMMLAITARIDKRKQSLCNMTSTISIAHLNVLKKYEMAVNVKGDQILKALHYAADKKSQKVHDLQSTFTLACHGAMQKYERAIIIKRDQIRNTLKYIADKNIEKVNNLQGVFTATYYAAMQRYERAIIFKKEQMENGLRKAVEKENIRRKNRMVILSAAIIIAVLIAIIIILIKTK